MKQEPHGPRRSPEQKLPLWIHIQNTWTNTSWIKISFSRYFSRRSHHILRDQDLDNLILIYWRDFHLSNMFLVNWDFQRFFSIHSYVKLWSFHCGPNLSPGSWFEQTRISLPLNASVYPSVKILPPPYSPLPLCPLPLWIMIWYNLYLRYIRMFPQKFVFGFGEKDFWKITNF